MSDFEFAFQLTIGNEGGFQNGKLDRGNWTGGFPGKGKLKGTKFGISAMSYPDLDIENLTLEQAHDIYERDYWLAANCQDYPRPVACEVFDAAVNHGVERAVGFVDSVISSPDAQAWKARLVATRIRFYTGLKTWLVYGKGWANRIAANLENGA